MENNMKRVSSNLTLVLKIFIPTMWIVFFTLLTLGILLSSPEDNHLFGNVFFKLGFLIFFLLFFAIIYFTLMRLLRVEYGDNVFSATNYFKTYRYHFDDVAAIYEYDLLFKKLIRIKMKAKTSLGSNLYFLRSAELYDDYVASHPHIYGDLLKK